MESLLSFQKLWVKLPRVASRGCECAATADGVPEAEVPPLPSECCLLLAAEFGAFENVSDLKALLTELLPSCFFTDYSLALYRGEGGGSSVALVLFVKLLQSVADGTVAIFF